MANIIMNYVLLLTFCTLILSQQLNIYSQALNLSLEIKFSSKSAPSFSDKASSLVTPNGNIIIAGTMCSFYGEKCKISFQIFNPLLELVNQKFLQGQSILDDFGGFIFTSDQHFLIQFLSKQSLFHLNIVNAYLISNDLNLIQNISFSKSVNPGIIGLLKYPLELTGNLNCYRIYFAFSDDHNRNNYYKSIDISKSLVIIKENEDKYFQSDLCYRESFLTISFFIQIGDFFYAGGNCINSSFKINPIIAKFDLNLSLINFFINPLLERGFYLDLFLYSLSEVIASILIISPRYSLLYNKFSISDLSLKEQIFESIVENKKINYISNILVVGKYFYSIYGLDLSGTKEESVITTDLSTLKKINSFDYSTDYFSCSDCATLLPLNLYKLNDTFIFSSGFGSFNNYNVDSYIHFFSITDPTNPVLSNTLYYGGSGNYLTAFIIDYNDSMLMIYGNDGNGIFIMLYSKEAMTIVLENKFRLRNPIQDINLIFLPNKKIILTGNTNSAGIKSPFLAEVDTFLYSKKLNDFSWMANLEITCSLNIESNKFAIAGSIKSASGLFCYYIEINLEYSVNGSPITIEIPNCKIELILLTKDQSKVLGVGQQIDSQKGILFAIKPIQQHIYVPNNKKIIFRSLIQLSDNIIIGGGSYYDGLIIASYYISFSTNLEIYSDWEDSSHPPSRISNFVRVTNEIIASTTIINNIAFMRYLRVKPYLFEIDIIIFFIIYFYPPSSSFWSIYPIQNDTILALGSLQLNSPKNPLVESILKLNPMCQHSWIFNPSNYECYPPCPYLYEIESSPCLEYELNICIKCQIPSDFYCSNDYFNQIYDVCCFNSSFKIINDSITFNELEQKITAKFNFEVTYFPFPIKLSLVSNSGLTSRNIKYVKYVIKGNLLTIYGITYSLFRSSSNSYINVDISKLRIRNNCGYELLNTNFAVNIYSNNYFNNFIYSFTNYLSSLMNKYKFL